MGRVPKRKSNLTSICLRGAALLAVVAIAAACSSMPKVTRTSSDEVIDVSGYWTTRTARWCRRK